MKKWNLFIAIIGGINCILVSILFFMSQLGNAQSILSLFPLPGLYLLEIAFLGILGFYSAYKNRTPLVWVVCGILLPIIFLGAWTVGLYLIPSLLTFGILAFILSGKKNIKQNFKYFIQAFLFQFGLMILLIFT